jgi:hypothetical protein
MESGRTIPERASTPERWMILVDTNGDFKEFAEIAALNPFDVLGVPRVA